MSIKGDWLLKLLIAEYIVISVTYLVQKDYPKAVYFIGAVILSIGVLLS